MHGYSRVPDHVVQQIATCSSDSFHVGRPLVTTPEELASGRWEHLGVVLENGLIAAAASELVPPASAGRWSKWNLNGRTITRSDLPKESRSIGSWTVPIYGDWNKGSFIVSPVRDVYPRERQHGKAFALVVEVTDSSTYEPAFSVRVDHVFDRMAIDQNDLLMACSLIRENVGRSPEAAATTATGTAWLAHQLVNWELLPPGTLPGDLLRRVLSGLPRSLPIERREEAIDRLEAVIALAGDDPAYVIGTSGFRRYVGVKFRDNLVALENLNYGNALYLFYENWEALSQRTRLELLADRDAHFDRVVHTDGWQLRLNSLLQRAGYERG